MTLETDLRMTVLIHPPDTSAPLPGDAEIVRNTRTMRFIATLTAAGATALALTSCSALRGVNEHEWTDARQMAASPESASVPSLVSPEATSIKLITPAYGDGSTYLSWDSPTSVSRKDCTDGPIGDSPTTSQPAWWPASVPTKGKRCGWWRVFEDDNHNYAWQQLPES